MDDVGGAEMHASVSGNVHFVAEDDLDAIRIAQKLLSFFPSNNTEDPPHHLGADVELYEDEGMNGLAQSDPSEPMDMQR